MKKIFTALALVFAAMFVAVCVSAYVKTGNTSPRISVYSPDGAPALGISNLLAGKEKFENFNTEYHVVDPLVIQTYVSGRNPAAVKSTSSPWGVGGRHLFQQKGPPLDAVRIRDRGV